MRFNEKEIKDLIFAGIFISLAFAILLSGSILNLKFSIFIIAFFTAGIGFLFHELMHKYIAQRYRLFAEFRANYGMIFLAVLFSFFGFIIAAPGAVYIHGYITREKNGKISLAGPMTNIVLAILFFILLLILNTGKTLQAFFSFGLTINSLLAVFNMIPLMPFDGAKVFAWNKRIYWIALALSAGLFISSFFV
ncbi:MAG: site-2 protease family protein [Candidatus Pacearchaeota archaeon]|nr:MAG: site-2 protease family protein [Candidatus Pacearchaeota archaeon]